MLKTSQPTILELERALRSLYPQLSDSDITRAALDLHDIEDGCRRIVAYVNSFAKAHAELDASMAIVRLHQEIFGHLLPEHIDTLKKVFKKVGLEAVSPESCGEEL